MRSKDELLFFISREHVNRMQWNSHFQPREIACLTAIWILFVFSTSVVTTCSEDSIPPNTSNFRGAWIVKEVVEDGETIPELTGSLVVILEKYIYVCRNLEGKEFGCFEIVPPSQEVVDDASQSFRCRVTFELDEEKQNLPLTLFRKRKSESIVGSKGELDSMILSMKGTLRCGEDSIKTESRTTCLKLSDNEAKRRIQREFDNHSALLRAEPRSEIHDWLRLR